MHTWRRFAPKSKKATGGHRVLLFSNPTCALKHPYLRPYFAITYRVEAVAVVVAVVGNCWSAPRSGD